MPPPPDGNAARHQMAMPPTATATAMERIWIPRRAQEMAVLAISAVIVPGPHKPFNQRGIPF
jgi:hypothetical protein